MQVTCPSCDAPLKAPDDIPAKQVKCNKSQHVFRTPETAPTATALRSLRIPTQPIKKKGRWGTLVWVVAALGFVTAKVLLNEPTKPAAPLRFNPVGPQV